MEEKILSSGTEAAARFPPLYVPSMFPKPSSLASLVFGEATQHSPNPKLAPPDIPIFYSVSPAVFT